MLPIRDLFIFLLGVITVLSETWIFEIKTRREWNAGTDSKIKMTVFGSRQTQSFELHGEFESGSLDVYSFDTSFGTPLEITILHNGDGLYSKWKLDYLTMWEIPNEADKRTFNCNCWLDGEMKTFSVPQQVHDATSTTVDNLLTTSTQGQISTEAATTTTSVTSRPNVETTASLTLTTGVINATDRPRSSTDATSTTVESLFTTTQEQKPIASARTTTNVTSRPNAETIATLTLTTGVIKTTDRSRSSTESLPLNRETTMTENPRFSSPDTTSPTKMYPNNNITNNRFCILVCQQKQTMEEFTKMVSKLKAELKIEKKVTNVYIRSRKSVRDKRTSSAAIGYTAVVILTTVGLGIVAVDLPRLIQSARLIRQHIKTTISYRRKQVV